jgi:hypothetical protein
MATKPDSEQRETPTEEKGLVGIASTDLFGRVYDVLVEHGGAYPEDRGNFIWAHTDSSGYPVDEWRFQGLLGYGGKYRRKTNTVDYYAEDKTPERELARMRTNTALHQLDHLFQPNKAETPL